MKTSRFLALTLVAVLVVTAFAGCASKNEETNVKEEVSTLPERTDAPEAENQDNLVGGWSSDIASGAALPEEVQKSFDKALNGYTGMSFEPVAYLGSQVVAGMNYAILCKGTPVVPNAKTSLKVVIIYANLSGEATITNVSDFSVAPYNTGNFNGSFEAVALAGGWSASDQDACTLPEEAATPFTKAVSELDGASYTPLAVVASQLVAGMNYAYICRVTPVVPDARGTLNVVIVYNDLSGNASITTVEPLNIGDFNK